MELNKENMKKIRWLIAFSVLLYLGVQNLDVVLKYVKIVWGLLLPFVLGGAMAFVLNVPMAFIERHVFGKAKEKEDRRGWERRKYTARRLRLLKTIQTPCLSPLLHTDGYKANDNTPFVQLRRHVFPAQLSFRHAPPESNPHF